MLLSFQSAWADVPNAFHTEGRLTDAVGDPLTGDVDIQLTLWDSLDTNTGNILYDETHAGITLSSGRFSLVVGEGQPSTDPATTNPYVLSTDTLESGAAYLQTTVTHDGTTRALDPLAQLLPVPYAMVAREAETIPALESRVADIEAGSLSLIAGATGPTGALNLYQNTFWNDGPGIEMAGNTHSETGRQGEVRFISGDGGGSNFRFIDYDADTNLFQTNLIIDSEGKVGIGTSSPDDRLHVSHTTNTGDATTAILVENQDQRLRLGSYYVSDVGQHASIDSTQDNGNPVGLVLNPSGGEVSVGGNADVSGRLVVSGELDVPHGLTSHFGLNPEDAWSEWATWIQGAEGSIGTQGGYGLTMIWNGYRELVDTFGVCVEDDQPTGEVCYQFNSLNVCPLGGSCVCADDYSTPSSVSGCGFTLGNTGQSWPLDDNGVTTASKVISWINLDNNGIDFRSTDYGPGDYPRKHQAIPGLRMRIAPDGDVDIEGDITFGPSNTSLTAALASAGGSVGNLVSVGQGALANNTTGENNVAIGIQALQDNGAGDDNVALGAYGLANNTSGNSNVAVGTATLLQNQDGSYNTGVGDRSLYSNTTGSYNTANGRYALYSNTEGSRNTASGAAALYKNTTGSDNTASGLWALYSNTTGDHNTASGKDALYSNTEGVQNSASGYRALYSNTTGYENTASGSQALYFNTEGFRNSASGYRALYSNTTGYNNTASGWKAFYSNTTGSRNTASGLQALYSNTEGFDNTASGYAALYSNTTGSRNTASGYDALYKNTTSSDNTASGWRALYSNTEGFDNTASGTSALYSNAAGSRNIALGQRAGYATTGSDNILIGNEGVAAESSTIRIGTPGTHTSTFVSGDVDVEGDLTVNGQVSGVELSCTQVSTVSEYVTSTGDVFTGTASCDGVGVVTGGSCTSEAQRKGCGGQDISCFVYPEDPEDEYALASSRMVGNFWECEWENRFSAAFPQDGTARAVCCSVE